MPKYHSDLFPDEASRKRQGRDLGAQLETSRKQISQGHVTPRKDLGSFRADLNAMTFDTGMPLEEVTSWVISQLQTGLVQMTHPGYMGLFNPAPSFPSECADRIMAAFNPQICVWSHAPVAVEIENHVIQQVACRAGMPEGATGHFTSGGSEANATAFLSALTRAAPDFGRCGLYAFSGHPRIYISAESHLAWLKIAHQCGVGRDAIRLIATDGSGRMSMSKLEAQIQTDVKAGDCPVMIVATAGTTNAGMVDPLPECAEMARLNNMWLHVDAAWGGALIASPRERHILEGMERADSITIDAHKWFATTMGAGMYLTPHKSVLEEAFRVSASYMPSQDAERDLYLNSMQWSRRFTGLRLFMALATAGWDGYARHIEHGIDLIDYLSAELAKRGWRRANESRMAVACFTPPESADPYRIVDEVIRSGREWISVAILEGQPVIRVCITNGMTRQVHVDGLIRNLCDAVNSA